MKRREFLRQAGAGGLGIGWACQSSGVEVAAFSKSDFFAGIQIGPHSLLDEGIDRCLDRLQETAGINTLLCYSHTYHMSYNSPPEILANDHGIEVRDMRRRKLPRVWVRHDPGRFRGSAIGHQQSRKDLEYHDRDVFSELIEAATKRGMKVHARMLEADMSRKDQIPGYDQVAAIGLDDQPSHGPCWNHPAYRQWLRLTVEEMFENYSLDGLQYGAERVGALSETLFRGVTPSCFCSHCIARNSAEGIDAARAKEGYRQIFALVQRLEAGRSKPIDGVFVSVLSILMEFPEVLSWYRQWLHADLEIGQMLSGTVKRVRPTARYGSHVDHQRSSWDIFYRAAVSYGEMAEFSDYVKPILYHDILGPRMRWWVVDRMHTRAMSDFSMDQVLAGLYAVLGHNPNEQPSLDQLNDQGLSPEYVFRETKRCVDGVDGHASVYSGIGLDVPWHSPKGLAPFPSDPELIFQSCVRAIEAGADGLIASREYDEMRMPSLEAFGRAVRLGK